MRHWIEAIFSLFPQGVVPKMGFAHQNVPHIFFLYLPKRKRAGHGTKEKTPMDELTGGAANSPIRRSERYALPTKSRGPLPAAPVDVP